METTMIWANLGVTDLGRTEKFYTALGFKPNRNSGSGPLRSFVFGENEFVIHFFLRDALIEAMNLTGEVSPSPDLVMFSMLAQSKSEVDQWADRVRKTKGQLIGEPEAFDNGYYGFVFKDPDGNRFNVFCM